MSTVTDIRIRTNFYLWLLTGRSSGFANASLNTDINYSVKSTPAEVVYAREFLRLNPARTDFNVLSVLAASMLSKPMLREMQQDIDMVYVPGLLQLPAVDCSATLLGPDEKSRAYLDGSIAGARGFDRLTITWLSASSALIETDSGIRDISPAAVMPVDGGTFRLRVENVSKYGVFADFGISAWNSDIHINLELAPTRYPFAATVTRLRQNRTMMRLMNAEGTLATFEASPANPALQVGMAGLAVIRRMLKWINYEQAGYTATLADGTDLREPLGRVYQFAPALIGDPAPSNPSQPVGFNV